ncbi:MAG TPA: hypothetical protein VF041_07160 [Gemmatimonadaceae bacterium]
MHMRSLARIVSWTLMAVVVGPLLACGDLAHTNPVDPEASVSIALAGPTAVHSHAQQVDYTFTSVPEWHYAAPAWESSDPSVLTLAVANGRFVSRRDGDVIVRLHLGPHTAELHVTVSQIATGLRIRTCNGAPATIPAPGGTLALCALAHDSIGSPVEGRAMTFSSANTSVVEMQDSVAVGRASGQTYVRASLGDLHDSLLVTVGG